MGATEVTTAIGRMIDAVGIPRAGLDVASAMTIAAVVRVTITAAEAEVVSCVALVLRPLDVVLSSASIMSDLAVLTTPRLVVAVLSSSSLLLLVLLSAVVFSVVLSVSETGRAGPSRVDALGVSGEGDECAFGVGGRSDMVQLAVRLGGERTE